MAEAGKIVNIRVNNLYPHPDNPRKNIGDVTELVESVRKSGIMQNLTVIPLTALHDEPEKQPEAEKISLLSDFIVLIGHRRMEAAKQAGLNEVPCRIVSKISKKEQVSVMLEENMQRNDLTIYEQAQGFQMMLDLGETEDSIAEKTGFSKTTIRHRLNIAKLNQKELKKKEEDGNFQLTLKDLYELEKVKSIQKRNEILKTASDSRDLAWRASTAAAEEIRDKAAKKIIKLLEAAGVKPAPDGVKNQLYSGKWETVRCLNLDADAPDKISLRGDVTKLMYLRNYREICVVRKKSEDKKATTAEKKEKELKADIKKIDAIVREMNFRKKEFIRSIITGKTEALKESGDVIKEVWDVLVDNNVILSMSSMKTFITGKREYEYSQEEREATKKQVMECGLLHQMLMMLDYAMDYGGNIYNYKGCYNKQIADQLKKGYAILEKYGWFFEPDEEKLLDGTHELYKK